MMSTWKNGRARLSAIIRENTLPMDLFLEDIARRKPHRVPGTAVFLTSDMSGAPPVLLHHLKHNQVLHEKVMLLSIDDGGDPSGRRRRTGAVPRAGATASTRSRAQYGFMETPDVPAILRSLGQRNDSGKPVPTKPGSTTFYLGRETLIAGVARQGRGGCPKAWDAWPDGARSSSFS